jgi:hypothetical protein
MLLEMLKTAAVGQSELVLGDELPRYVLSTLGVGMGWLLYWSRAKAFGAAESTKLAGRDGV